MDWKSYVIRALEQCSQSQFVRWLARRPAVLMYHGVPRRPSVDRIDALSFERHVTWLKEHFDLLPVRECHALRPRGARPAAVLTFDDGYRNNAEVVAPILHRLRVPAVFFVSSRHAVSGQYLWFTYLEALREQFPEPTLSWCGERFDMSGPARDRSVQRLREKLLELKPHPEGMYRAIATELPPLNDFISEEVLCDRYEGMTAAQVRALASDPLFTFGIHTVDHPYLTRCTPVETFRQIRENQLWLEAESGKACNMTSYPLGDYDQITLQQCHSLGLEYGFAVVPKVGTDRRFEISRIGIHAPSLKILKFKAVWGDTLGVERWPRFNAMEPQMRMTNQCSSVDLHSPRGKL
jgi:peptidoglycan/xylan/chitin deacetylase (PgdA/CDA1 family)